METALPRVPRAARLHSPNSVASEGVPVHAATSQNTSFAGLLRHSMARKPDRQRCGRPGHHDKMRRWRCPGRCRLRKSSAPDGRLLLTAPQRWAEPLPGGRGWASALLRIGRYQRRQSFAGRSPFVYFPKSAMVARVHRRRRPIGFGQGGGDTWVFYAPAARSPTSCKSVPPVAG